MRITVAYISKGGSKSWLDINALNERHAYKIADTKARRYNWQSYFLLTPVNFNT